MAVFTRQVAVSLDDGRGLVKKGTQQTNDPE